MRHAKQTDGTTRAAVAISCCGIPTGLILAPPLMFAAWWIYDWFSRTPAGAHPLLTVALMVVAVGGYVAWARRERS